MTILRSSAFSIIILLSFEMCDVNGALFLNDSFFWVLSFSSVAAEAAASS